MPKLTVKNKQTNPTFVFAADGQKMLDPGATYTGEFSDGEAANLRGNTAAFDVTGDGVTDNSAKPDKSGEVPEHIGNFLSGLQPVAERVHALGIDDFTGQMTTALDERDAAAKSVADIRAALDIGEGDDILATIAKLKSGNANANANANSHTGGKLTLEKAIASLDDKNEAHWTDAGKPDLDTLKSLTGDDVRRADVDALVPPRVRAKP